MDSKKKTILLIDDNKKTQSVITRFLEVIGDFKIFKANGGVKGLRIAKRKHPDLILLDIMMPDINGVEVLKALKEDTNTYYIPVIMLTGVNDSETMKEAMYEYAQQYILKPFNIDDLAEAIKKALPDN